MKLRTFFPLLALTGALVPACADGPEAPSGGGSADPVVKAPSATRRERFELTATAGYTATHRLPGAMGVVIPETVDGRTQSELVFSEGTRATRCTYAPSVKEAPVAALVSCDDRSIPGRLVVADRVELSAAGASPASVSLEAWPEPRMIGDLADVLEQSTALVEAEVVEVEYAFDRERGPRTRVRMAAPIVHIGSVDPGELVLDMYGGPLPDGRYARISEQPHLVLGGRYLFFLRNSYWFYEPIVGDALRIELVAGAHVLVGDSGNVVSGFGAAGATYGASLFDPVVEMSHPFERPRLLDGVGAEQIETAVSPDELVDRVHAFADERGIELGGGWSSTPRSTHAWQRGPSAPPATHR